MEGTVGQAAPSPDPPFLLDRCPLEDLQPGLRVSACFALICELLKGIIVKIRACKARSP